jgi:RimJ/RimL family protein N-acetyltransferase
MLEYKSFETERLFLRPTNEEDAEFIIELMNTPKWIQFIGDRNVKSIDSAKEYIKTKITPQLQRLGYATYTLILKSDQTKIGTCGLYDREGLGGIDIGFAFLPQYEGQGYGFESADKLIQVAIQQFDVKEINAITTKDNIVSQKLLEKLGLALNGFTKLPNDDEELLLYKLIRN